MENLSDDHYYGGQIENQEVVEQFVINFNFLFTFVWGSVLYGLFTS